MKVLTDSTRVLFDPVCPACKFDNTLTAFFDHGLSEHHDCIEVDINTLITESGCPLCRKCHAVLTQEQYSEAET